MNAVKQMLDLYADGDPEPFVRDAALQAVRVLFKTAKEEEVVSTPASSAVAAAVPVQRSDSFIAEATRSQIIK